MNILKKYKPFLSDMILNMIGFGIYIISQQILLLPLLGKMVSDEVYANLVLYLSILNVVCNVTGGELGNTRLVQNSNYKKKNIIGDFTRILVNMSPIIAVVVFPIFLYLNHGIVGSLLFTITILMANVRLYSLCYYRLEQKYDKVIKQNLYYLIGMLISLAIFYFTRNIYLVLLVPEIFSIIYALKNSDLLVNKYIKTSEMKPTLRKFSKLGVVSLLTNMVEYFDKFLIYSLFGPAIVAVYYAVNSMSKIASLISTPMSNVILSWVSNVDEKENKHKILRLTLLSNIPVLVIVTLITLPLTYIAVRILYNQFLEDAMILMLPIALTTAFGTAISLIKAVLLKYSNTNKLIHTYIIYFIVFISLGWGLSKVYGLIGFASATLISKVVLWILFIILLFLSEKEKITNEKGKDDEGQEEV